MTRFDIHSASCVSQDTHPGITACKPCNCWVGKITALEKELAAMTAERDMLKAFAGRQRLRSDFRTADEMRAALDKMTAERDAVTRCNCPQCQPVTGDCPAATELSAVTKERDEALRKLTDALVAAQEYLVDTEKDYGINLSFGITALQKAIAATKPTPP